MPKFIDESGNWIASESEDLAHFRLAAVWFETENQVLKCRDLICELRAKLGLPDRFEFHFADIGKKLRLAFLRTMTQLDFRYVVVSKPKWAGAKSKTQRRKFYGSVVKVLSDALEQFYRFAEKQKGSPLNERVWVDKHTDKKEYLNAINGQFKRFESKARKGRKLVKKVGWAELEHNDLIQLADMVCGAVRWHLDESSEFRTISPARKLKFCT